MVKVYFKEVGNTLNANLAFKNQLKSQINLLEVSSERDSDVIIAVVPIVSRAGTDLKAALNKIPESRPVVLVVLHYTFDPYFVAPDGRLSVNMRNVFTVDCLFHEDRGLLRCERNNKALKAVKEYLDAGMSAPNKLCRFQVLGNAWRLPIIYLTFVAMDFDLLNTFYCIVLLFFLMALLDWYLHVKWIARFVVLCFLVVTIGYIYYSHIEELILSTSFPTLEPVDNDFEQKAEMTHNVNQIINQNMDQNINQNMDQNINQNVDQNINQNVDQNINQNVDQNRRNHVIFWQQYMESSELCSQSHDFLSILTKCCTCFTSCLVNTSTHYMEAQEKGAHSPMKKKIKDSFISKKELDSIQAMEREDRRAIAELRMHIDKLTDKIADLEDRIRRKNIRLVGLPESVEGSDAVGYLRSNIPNWIPALKGRDIEIDCAHRVYNGRGNDTGRPRTLIFRVLRWQDRMAILNEAQKAHPVKHAQNTLLFLRDLSPATIAKRKSFSPVMKKMIAMGLQPILLYPATVKLQYGGNMKMFDSPQKAEDFVQTLSRQETVETVTTLHP